LQGLSIQPRESLNSRAVRTDLGGWIYTQRAGLPARRLGLQTLPRGAADPLALGLQPSAQVFPQGPRLGRPRTRCLNARASPASGGCNVGRGQVLVTCPIPKPGSPSARCSQPQGACLQTGAWGLQVGTSPFAHQTMQFTVKALTTYSTRTIVQNSAIYSESTHNAE